MEFLEKNLKGIAVGFGGLIVVGLVLTLVMQNNARQEQATQEKYFSLDAKAKKYHEEKAKKANPAADDTDKKADKVDIKIDVVQLKTDLNSFVNQNTGTVAAQMAGLELSQLLIEDGKLPEALTLLQKVETKTDFLSNVLVRMKLAQILADQDKCSDALTLWSKVLSTNAASYIHAEAKINQALCFKKMNELQKAEDILNQVKNDKSEDAAGSVQEAERILRLIQFNKSFGT